MIEAADGRFTLFCAESCTAGLVSATLGANSGASSLLWGSGVVYSGQAKTMLTGVAPSILGTFGEVSEAAIEGMLQGIFDRYPVNLSVAISGIAGPTGGTPAKPVGLVYIGVGVLRTKTRILSIEEFHFKGDRNTIQRMAAKKSFDLLYDSIIKEPRR